MIKILYFRSKCIGCHACVEAAPARFRMSKKDGKSTLIKGTEKAGIFQAKVGWDELEHLEKAAKNCPVNIIRVNEN